MEDQNINFDKTSKEILEKSKKEIIENFKALEKTTKDVDPVPLLSQFALSTIANSGVEKRKQGDGSLFDNPRLPFVFPCPRKANIG